MRESCPEAVVIQLELLELADAQIIDAAGRQARRLARGLPLFESLWIDALVQAGVLTQFQASEIHLGRGGELVIGPFILVDRFQSSGPVRTYQALERGQQQPLHLIVADLREPTEAIGARLEQLVARSKRLTLQNIAGVKQAQVIDGRAVIACPAAAGTTAAQWLARKGRFAPSTVLQIARTIVRALVELESVGLAHGDLATEQIVLTAAGDVVLLAPGVRPALRPIEVCTTADLPASAYAGIAPERIREGSQANSLSDVYGCGILCWHLLTGRPPWPTANSLATIRAILHGRVPDLSQLAANVPIELARAISACTEPEASRRPQSLSELEEMLGQAGRLERLNLAAPGSSSMENGLLLSSQAPAKQAASAGWLIGVSAALALLLGASYFAASRAELATQEQAARFARMQAATLTQKAQPATQSKMPQAGSKSESVDPHIARVSYLESAEASDDLILPHDRPLRLDSISPRPGQIIRGQPNSRPQIWLGKKSLNLTVDHVRFIGIDFVWRGAATTDTEAEPAMIDLAAHHLRFDDCSFQTAPGSFSRPVVARCVSSGEERSGTVRLPTTTIHFSNCAMHGMRSVLDNGRPNALVAEFTNVLFVEIGSIVRLQYCPSVDSPLMISLASSTLRQFENLGHFAGASTDARVGRTHIRTENCAFSAGRDAALLKFDTRETAKQLLSEVEWDGQGCVLDGAVAMTAIDDQIAVEEEAAEQMLSSAGFVRCAVEFFGKPSTVPGDSEVRRWTAPLTSSEPPGIRSRELHVPTLNKDQRSPE